jgi:hypothetical protein
MQSWRDLARRVALQDQLGARERASGTQLTVSRKVMSNHSTDQPLCPSTCRE